MNIGEKFTFKVSKGRGRPFVGEIIKKQGVFTVMKMKNGEEVRISTKNIIKPYEFKPYNTRKRDAA